MGLILESVSFATPRPTRVLGVCSEASTISVAATEPTPLKPASTISVAATEPTNPFETCTGHDRPGCQPDHGAKVQRQIVHGKV